MNTAQTITGIKTFTDNVTAPNFVGNLSGISTERFIYGENSTGTTAIPETVINAHLKSGFYRVDKVDGLNLPINNTSANMLLHVAYNGVNNRAGFDLLTTDVIDSRLNYRNSTGLGYSGWKTLAYLTDNVASATKLQTALATIWGQSFNGEGRERIRSVDRCNYWKFFQHQYQRLKLILVTASQ